MATEVPTITCAVHGEKIEQLETSRDDHEKRLRKLEAAWMKVAGATAFATVLAQFLMKVWLK